MGTSKPLIIAHRGASGEAPENTMAAFRLARSQGADGIELDIIQTRDGQIVVCHDEEVSRLTGQNLLVRKSTLADLKKLDFGKGEKIPTLREVFESFGNLFSVINVEIKSTGYLTDGIEKKLVALIRECELSEKVFVSSFNVLHLLRMKRLAPEIKRGYLVWPEQCYSPWRIWPTLSDAATVNLPHEWANDSRLEKYRGPNRKIWVWTVNDEADMKRWIKLGAQAIITDHPARLKKILEGKVAKPSLEC